MKEFLQVLLMLFLFSVCGSSFAMSQAPEKEVRQQSMQPAEDAQTDDALGVLPPKSSKSEIQKKAEEIVVEEDPLLKQLRKEEQQKQQERTYRAIVEDRLSGQT